MPATGQRASPSLSQRHAAASRARRLTVVDGRGVRYQASTNAAGVGTIYGLPDGDVKVYAFAPGYLPVPATADVADGTRVAHRRPHRR